MTFQYQPETSIMYLHLHVVFGRRVLNRFDGRLEALNWSNLIPNLPERLTATRSSDMFRSSCDALA